MGNMQHYFYKNGDTKRTPPTSRHIKTVRVFSCRRAASVAFIVHPRAQATVGTKPRILSIGL